MASYIAVLFISTKSQIDIDRETVTIIDLSTIEEGHGLMIDSLDLVNG